MTDKLVWYSASADIARMGPFPTQARAWEALRSAPATRRFESLDSLIPMPKHVHGVHVTGAYVWPEVE
jgi:hypothetical protein